MTNQTKRIEAYAIADFVKQIEDCILQGFRLNLEDNDKYPLQIGVGFYCTVERSCTMDKVEHFTVKEAVDSTITQVKEISSTREFEVVNIPSSKPGRKPKG